ncbi:MAG: hydrogenase [Candidatus Acidiferrales bacterium]
MSFWFWHGLKKRVHSTRYPKMLESAAGVTPGRPLWKKFPSAEEVALAAANCPVDAILPEGDSARVDLRHCIYCERCHFGGSHLLEWRFDYEWATPPPGKSYQALPRPYGSSLHVIAVDAGDCGACLHEVKQLNNPFYNMHRLGIFFTATPRTADVLLVVGPVSENMRVPLLKTYEAMPNPKRVIAVGACAITGGVFGSSFVSAGGAASILPVDLEIPGDPPPPLAILHGLLVATGRKSCASLELPAERSL